MSEQLHENRGGYTPIFDAYHAAWAGAVLNKDDVMAASHRRQLEALSTEELVEGYAIIVHPEGGLTTEPCLLPDSEYPARNYQLSEPFYCRSPWF